MLVTYRKCRIRDSGTVSPCLRATFTHWRRLQRILWFVLPRRLSSIELGQWSTRMGLMLFFFLLWCSLYEFILLWRKRPLSFPVSRNALLPFLRSVTKTILFQEKLMTSLFASLNASSLGNCLNRVLDVWLGYEPVNKDRLLLKDADNMFEPSRNLCPRYHW